MSIIFQDDKIFRMLEKRYIYEQSHEPDYLDYIGISRLQRVAMYIKDYIAIATKNDPPNGGYWPSDIIIGQKVLEISLNIDN